MIEKIGPIGVDIIDLFRAHNFSYNIYYHLKKIQHYPINELETLVKKKTTRLLKHAVEKVPFYTDYYKVILDDKKNENISLNELPITTKNILRPSFPDRLRANGLKKRAIYNTTSGSTGEPFEFFNDVHAFPHRQASFMLFNNWMDVCPHERHVSFKSPGPLSFKTKLRNRLFGKNVVSVLDIDREHVRDVLTYIDKINPIYLEGYTASLVNFARYVNEMSLSFVCHPEAIITTSEDLTGVHRKLLENTFDTKVYDRYGSREFSGAVAQECGICEGYHVNNLLCEVEIVDSEGQLVEEGERGKILITDLTNYAMPFIRYEIGDSAIKGPENSDCEISFPRIIDIVGREGQFIESATGEKIPFITISAYLFRRHYAPHVFSYQFEQMKPGKLILRLVPTKKFSQEIKKGMYRYLEESLPGFSIEIEIVNDIPTVGNGKRPFLVPRQNI